MEIAAPAKPPEVTVVVPARNEQACLGDCLSSLTAQAGVTFEIIVVDDHSTDRTREIAESFTEVRVISSPPLPPGWTGKNNAVIAGASQARGAWLLFTDADTVHMSGSLARTVAEANTNGAALLSYSPEQIAGTFWERVVMPVVFAELAAQYPPEKVRDTDSGLAAANGQYVLVRADTYRLLGGHQAVATRILEDVALAQRFKSAGYRIRFRYGGDAVRTRMYRSWSELRDGWTKNLALLFPQPLRQAAVLTLWWLFSWVTLPVLLPALFLFLRIRRAHFSSPSTILATAFGPPMFAFLLLRSKRAHFTGRIFWKGRRYQSDPPADANAKPPDATHILSARN